MTLAKSFITGGFVLGSNNNSARVSGLSLATLLPQKKLAAIVPGDNPSEQEYLSIPNYVDHVGDLTAEPSIRNYQEIKLTVTPNFPSNFLGYFAILRGRYGYKTNFTDQNTKIVYENFGFPTEDIVVYDDEIEPLHTYYYSIVAICGDISLEQHIEYNPSFGFDWSYSYKNYSHGSKMYNLLPEEYIKLDKLEFSNETTDTEKLLNTFGFIFDMVLSELNSTTLREVNILHTNYEQLPEKAALIGWLPNRELSGELQRKELLQIVESYKQKGILQGIEDLVSLFSDYGFCYEYGRDRLLRSNTTGISIDYDNSTLLANLGVPWYCSGEQDLGETDGTDNQEFSIDVGFIKELCVFVDGVSYYVVDNLLQYNETDEVVEYLEDAATGEVTLTFGDDFHGKKPDAGLDVTVKYKIRGDIGFRSVGQEPSWYNEVGVNVIVDLTTATTSLEQRFIDKVKYVFNEFVPSYTILNFTYRFPSDNSETEIPPFEDSFEDEVISISYFISDEEDHITDNEDHLVG